MRTSSALPRATRPLGAVLRPLAAAAIALLALCVGEVEGQAAPDEHPFFAGERLEFAARVVRARASGTGAMWIEGPVELRGRQALRLRFDFFAKVGFVKAEDRTESWLDARSMASLRYLKHESHPLSKNDEQVELFPEERRWTNAEGEKGTSPTDAPLDELSFMYFLRTLPLDSDSLVRFDRHFDPRRSPTSVRVVGRETVTTPAGTFRALVVEMKVKDPRRYRGEGTIRVTLSDDECRLPLRIESRMPIVGAAVLTLTKHNHAGGRHLAARLAAPASSLASAAP